LSTETRYALVTELVTSKQVTKFFNVSTVQRVREGGSILGQIRRWSLCPSATRNEPTLAKGETPHC